MNTFGRKRKKRNTCEQKRDSSLRENTKLRSANQTNELKQTSDKEGFHSASQLWQKQQRVVILNLKPKAKHRPTKQCEGDSKAITGLFPQEQRANRNNSCASHRPPTVATEMKYETITTEQQNYATNRHICEATRQKQNTATIKLTNSQMTTITRTHKHWAVCNNKQFVEQTSAKTGSRNANCSCVWDRRKNTENSNHADIQPTTITGANTVTVQTTQFTEQMSAEPEETRGNTWTWKRTDIQQATLMMKTTLRQT